MNDTHIEALDSIRNDEYQGDRERRSVVSVDQRDVPAFTKILKEFKEWTVDMTNQLEHLHDFSFRTDQKDHEDEESYTEEDFAQDEIQANHETDAKRGL